MITNIEHFRLKRLTSREYVYSQTSVLDFGDVYQASFIPTFDKDDTESQVQYILQFQYCLPNENFWYSQYGFYWSFTFPKVHQEVSSPFSLGNVDINHRESGTRYRLRLAATDGTSSMVSDSSCLFVPPVLGTMHETNWQVGIPYVHANGSWHKAKSVFVYHNNNWTESIIE